MRGLLANGDKIRQLRKSRAWTQERLARVANCSVRTVSNAERNVLIDAATLARLAAALGVSLATLTAYEPSTTSDSSRIQDRREAIIRSWIAAYLAQDVETMMALFTDDVVIEIPGSENMAGGGIHAGREAVRAHLMATFANFQVEPVADDEYELLVMDDRIIYLGHASAKVIATGNKFTAHLTHDFHFSSEKIRRLVTVFDTAPMRQAIEGE